MAVVDAEDWKAEGKRGGKRKRGPPDGDEGARLWKRFNAEKADPNAVWVFAWRFSFSMKNYIGQPTDAYTATCLQHFKTEVLEDLKDAMRTQAGDKDGHWIFQLECTKTPEGRDNWHYQGMLKRATKCRPNTLGGILGDKFPGIYVASCSIAGREALRTYCMKKDETYRAGPWADKAISPTYLGKDIKCIEESPHAWERDLLDEMAQEPVPRIIKWVYEPHGGVGKSTFSKYVGFKKGAVTLQLDTAANLLDQVITRGPSTIYIVDIPRTRTRFVTLDEIFHALEQIKNGDVSSNKRTHRHMYMEPPHVYVFSNFLPPGNKLSEGRLHVRYIDSATKAFGPIPPPLPKESKRSESKDEKDLVNTLKKKAAEQHLAEIIKNALLAIASPVPPSQPDPASKRQPRREAPQARPPYPSTANQASSSSSSTSRSQVDIDWDALFSEVE